MKTFEHIAPTGERGDKLFCGPAFSAPQDQKHRNQHKRYDDPGILTSYRGQRHDDKRDPQGNSGLGHSAILAVVGG